MKRNKVLIIQEVMKHYRVPFYERLYELLEEHDIELSVSFSLPDNEDIEKADNITLPEYIGNVVPVKKWLKGKLVFQLATTDIIKADLVIVEQANKQLINYLLIIARLLGLKRFAFWGHGKNFQAESFNSKEKMKAFLITTPNWWFAYTKECADYISECGFPAQRITNVENSIDIQAFKALLNDINKHEIEAFKKQLDIKSTEKLGIYCGAMYSEKELPFLLDCLEKIKERYSNFQFIFVGAGPDQHLVSSFCIKHSWCHYLGPLFERDKALVFRAVDVMLNPGLVGLGVLDAFAAELPMVTTHYKKHSPEAYYLKHELNGLISEFNKQDFTNLAVNILIDNPKRLALSKEAKQSAEQYSIENMAAKYASGIYQALKDN